MSADLASIKEWEVKAKAAVAGLGKVWTASIVMSTARRQPYPTLHPRKRPAGAQPTNGEVLKYLEESGRVIFTLTATMRANVLRETMADIKRRGLKNLNASALRLLVAGHWRREVLARWREGRGIKRPSEAWRRRKVRLGLEPGPARASNQLLHAVEKARLIVERRG